MGRPAKYPEEFRREAVALYRSSDRSRAEVARSLGIADGSLAAWVKEAERDETPDALDPDERAELNRLRTENKDLRMDRETCGKQPRISRGRRTGEPQVRLRACRPVSGAAALRARRREAIELLRVGEPTIYEIHVASRRTYGAPRVAGQLHNAGRHHSGKRVARIMAECGLIGAHSRRKWRRGRANTAPAPDLLERDFTADRSDQRWVADITEFGCRDRKLYLAGIKDLHDQGLAGWSMGERQTTDLVVNALVMALARREPDGDLIHNHQGNLTRSMTLTTAVAWLLGYSSGSVLPSVEDGMTDRLDYLFTQSGGADVVRVSEG